MANASAYTDKQRITALRVFHEELRHICDSQYAGDWDKMPEHRSDLGLDWNKVIRRSRIKTTPAGFAKLVDAALERDDLVNEALDMA